MKKLTPYLTNGWPKTCHGCGNPFVVRNGNADVILGLDGHFYCYGTDCAHDAFAAETVPFKRAA